MTTSSPLIKTKIYIFRFFKSKIDSKFYIFFSIKDLKKIFTFAQINLKFDIIWIGFFFEKCNFEFSSSNFWSMVDETLKRSCRLMMWFNEVSFCRLDLELSLDVLRHSSLVRQPSSISKSTFSFARMLVIRWGETFLLTF